ncbi:uncharacterized protein LOC115891598 [Sitophilus oryzae]|uniref:Uncharacterized protein LOC115891598 n=1 Tax=Sitophilus oryzae TaxID=7048 RepID=A0A6J2YV14_SITOR|nr:uncharacterized protein LOC115891598 [Sitophilus oryzae]
MTAQLFVRLLEHISNHTQSSPTNPILLLMDNHETHVSAEAINYSRDHSIVLLSFPPHCTHKMQPLDKAVYGPFKQKCKVSFNDHILNNPGAPITIYDIAKLTSGPYLQSFTPKNITSGFSSTGLWPINRLIFSDSDFFGAYATDRPQPESTGDLTSQPNDHLNQPSTSFNHSINSSNIPSTSSDHPPSASDHLTSLNDVSVHCVTKEVKTTAMIRSIIDEIIDVVTKPPVNIISVHPIVKPSDVKPFPKAPSRKTNRKSRIGKSRIYTSTPEKIRVEELEDIRRQKLDKSETKKKLVIQTSATKLKKKSLKTKPNVQEKQTKKTLRKVTKRANESPTSSDSESEYFKAMKKKNRFLESPSDSDTGMESDCDEFTKLLDDETISCDDFVLVRFPTKKTVVYYVGQVIELAEYGEFVIKYLRHSQNRFHFPFVDDISNVARCDIEAKLPKPTTVAGNARLASFLKFNVNFSSFNLK